MMTRVTWLCGEVMVTRLCVASHEFITELRRENHLSKLLPWEETDFAKTRPQSGQGSSIRGEVLLDINDISVI